jgi:hypothetical protein
MENNWWDDFATMKDVVENPNLLTDTEKASIEKTVDEFYERLNVRVTEEMKLLFD